MGGGEHPGELHEPTLFSWRCVGSGDGVTAAAESARLMAVALPSDRGQPSHPR